MPHESPQKPPRGLTAIAVFLFFGAAMALLAGTTLIFPGTVLDRAWRLNPVAYAQLAPLGPPVGIVFIIAGCGFGGRGHRMVAPPPLGMGARGGYDRHSSLGGSPEFISWRCAAGRGRRSGRRRFALLHDAAAGEDRILSAPASPGHPALSRKEVNALVAGFGAVDGRQSAP